MTKNELTKAIASKANLTQAQAAAAYEALIGSIAEALNNGEKVSLVGFGTFELKDVPAKDGIKNGAFTNVSTRLRASVCDLWELLCGNFRGNYP